MMEELSTVEIEGDGVVEDLETHYNKIADQLAELSAAEQVPTGVKAVQDPFEPSDVDFASNGWLLRVLQVQGWLHADSEVSAQNAERDATACALSFFAALGAEEPDRCVQVAGDLTQLSLA